MKKEGGLFGALFQKKAGSKDEPKAAPAEEKKATTAQAAPAAATAAVVEPEPEVPPPPDVYIEGEGGGLRMLWETGYADSNVTPDLIFECGANPLPMDPMRHKLEAKRMRGWVESLGTTHMKVVAEGLKKLNADQEAEKEMAATEGRTAKKVKAPPIDGKAALSVSSDGMVAWLIMLPPMGDGAHVTRADINLLLEEEKIIHGLNEEYLNSMLKHKRYFQLYPIVMGTPADNGKNGYITDYYAKERICVFTPDADGNLDYRAQNYFQPVFAEGTICEIHLPTEGTPGTNIRGDEMPPKPGDPAKVTVGKNTHITEAGTELVADLDGDVVFEGGAFVVRSTMQVTGDVDYSTGNINFMGDVHVKGNVRDKFIVRATGSVIVDGLLESAIIDADGDVIIAGGVLGDNEGTIRSRGNVRAKFMESCTVYAAQSVQTDYILGSKVFCDGPLMVTSGKGIIMGGTISVHSYIEAKSIGSPHSGRVTTINMGVPACGGDEDFVENQGIDPAAMLQEMAEQAQAESGEEVAADATPVEAKAKTTQLVNCRGKFSNLHVGVVINFARDTLNIEREWNGVSVRYDEKEQRILLT